MRPAAEDREHAFGGLVTLGVAWPQWSRPLKTGRTYQPARLDIFIAAAIQTAMEDRKHVVAELA
jgi:hypothetical protein